MIYTSGKVMHFVYSVFNLLKTFFYSQLHHSRSFLFLLVFIITVNIIYVPNTWNVTWYYIYTFVLLICFSYILVQFDFENTRNTSNRGNQFKLYTKSILLSGIAISLIYLLFYVFINTNIWNKNLLLYSLIGCSVYLLYKVRYNSTSSEDSNNHSFMFAKLLTEPFILLYNIGYISYCQLKKYINKLSNTEERHEILRNIVKMFKKYQNSLLIIFICILFLIIEFFPFSGLSILSSNTTLLLKDPVYLNKMHTIGKVDMLNEDKRTRNYSFSIQCWIYIDQNSPSQNIASNLDTTLLDYGNIPLVTYNVKTKKLMVFIKQGENDLVKLYETSTLRLQKWNYFVFNYHYGTMDIFINAVLVASENNIIPIMKQDEIICGSENGLLGGIKNVYYSKDIVNTFELNITYMSYNLFQTSYFLPNNI